MSEATPPPDHLGDYPGVERYSNWIDGIIIIPAEEWRRRQTLRRNTWNLADLTFVDPLPEVRE